MQFHCFVTNPFYENTYLLWDSNNIAVVIDPGFYSKDEEEIFLNFIRSKNLKLQGFLLTHAHIDHIFGSNFIYRNFGLLPRMNRKEEMIYRSAPVVAKMYGLNEFEYPEPGEYIIEDTNINIGEMNFEVLFTPGHSPGSLSFYQSDKNYVISGDCLFDGSIGRTDLPGGDYNTLIHSIKTTLLNLPENTTVYSGHGQSTTIRKEKVTNPFLK